MGTSTHLLLDGEVELLQAAYEEVMRLEQLWSRFIPESDISRLNAAEGVATEVSIETIELIERSLEGWKMTDGLFDPAILKDLIAVGYDRDFDEVLEQAGPAFDVDRSGLETDAIEIDRKRGAVTLPQGVAIDSGGIGKGFGADLVVQKLLDAGADTALLNLGGDLRSAGRFPAGGWRVSLDNPFTPSAPPIAELELEDAALATSTSLTRRWQQEGEDRHHLIDPRTGQPAQSDVASVSVVAASGWQAEVLAKGCFLGGVETALSLLSEHDATGLVVGVNGQLHTASGLDRYLASPIPVTTLKTGSVSGKVTVRIPTNF